MPSVGFENAILEIERPQIYAFNHTATKIKSPLSWSPFTENYSKYFKSLLTRLVPTATSVSRTLNRMLKLFFSVK